MFEIKKTKKKITLIIPPRNPRMTDEEVRELAKRIFKK